jgi:membrane fusion protein, multidrug efflux system
MKTKINYHIYRMRLLCQGIILFSLTGISSCKGPSANTPPEGPVPVSVYRVKEEKPLYFDLYPGNILALNEVRLMSEVSGYITGIYFKEGQQIKKGQKLYEIEPEKYAASYQQALANYKIAQSNLEKAAKDEERYTALGKLDAIARQRVEYAHTDFKNAKQQVSASKAEMVKAETDLHHSIITAPFDGTIGISLVKMGTLATAGQTQLNTLSSNNPMAVDFVISEKEIGKFQNLKEQIASDKDSTFTITLPDGHIYEHAGHIEFFDRNVDPQTGTLRIRLQFPNLENKLKPGMSCNVRVLNRIERNSILIPLKSVTEQMGEFFVYVVKKDTARQNKVILGHSVKDSVIVKSGLYPGEQIVVEGLQKLHDGSPVTTKIPLSGIHKQASYK